MTFEPDGWSAAGIDIRLLRYFTTVADELHFTRAAQRLYVSQPALSNQIKRLEAQLGVAVFARSSRGVTLTPAGTAFLPYAQLALSTLQTGIARAAAAAGGHPVLRIDVIDAALSTPRQVLSSLRARHPELPLHVTTLGTAGQRQRILTGELDVGFCGADAATGQNIDHDIIRYEPIDAILPADHALADVPNLRLAALADEVFYLPHDSVAPEWNDYVRHACREAGFTLRRHSTATDGAATGLDLIREGGCVTLGLRSTPHPEGTVAIPLAEPSLRYPWAMIWRPDGYAAPIDQVRRAAREAARTHRWMP